MKMYDPNSIELWLGDKKIESFTDEIEEFVLTDLKIGGKTFKIKIRPDDLKYIKENFGGVSSDESL